ncbi:MAG: ribbon-helix-helix protein, CopG family [Patescibacteria group bacterium]
MKKANETRGVRLGELLDPLQAHARAEGTTQTEIIKRALRAYLGIRATGTVLGKKRVVGSTWGNVRWGDILENLDTRAAREGVSSSSLARRAVRLYLANGEVPQILQFINELREHHAKLARIGGNLNRIARLVNADGILARSDLGQVHIALIEAFKPLADLYKRVEKMLERQRP